MGKQRATITSCDLEECAEHYLGDERPDNWLNVAIKSNDIENTERLTFCSYEDLMTFAGQRMEARKEGAASDDS